jgi:hypothetical protein
LFLDFRVELRVFFVSLCCCLQGKRSSEEKALMDNQRLLQK